MRAHRIHSSSFARASKFSNSSPPHRLAQRGHLVAQRRRLAPQRRHLRPQRLRLAPLLQAEGLRAGRALRLDDTRAVLPADADVGHGRTVADHNPRADASADQLQVPGLVVRNLQRGGPPAKSLRRADHAAPPHRTRMGRTAVSFAGRLDGP